MKASKIEKKSAEIAKKGGRIGKKLPRLETMFEEDGDPLELVEYNDDDLEQSATDELGEIARLIKERKKAMFDAFRVVSDPDYFFCVCFQSSAQRDEFLSAANWLDMGVKYINGLARRLGVKVEPIEISPSKPRGKPKKYTKKEVI